MKWNSGRLWLRIIAYSLTVLLGLFVLTQAFVLWQIDKTSIRDAITQSLIRTGRTIKIEGPVDPRLFPFPGFSLHNLTITERDGVTRFMTIRDVDIRLAWLPLLLGRYEVRAVTLAGFDASVLRHPDGTLSISDLFTHRQHNHFNVRLDYFSLRQGQLHYHDLANTMTGQFESIYLKATELTGHAKLSLTAVLNANKQPVQITLNTPLTLDDGNIIFNQIKSNAYFKVDSLGKIKLSSQGKVNIDTRSLEAHGENLTFTFTSEQPRHLLRLSVPILLLNPNSIALPKGDMVAHASEGHNRYSLNARFSQLTFQHDHLSAKQIKGNLDWKMPGNTQVKLTLSAPLQLKNGRHLNLSPLHLTSQIITPLLPRGHLVSTISGKIKGDIRNSQLSLSGTGKLDGSSIALMINQHGFIRPRHDASITIGQLDLNRYLPETHGSPEAIFQNTKAIPLNWLDAFDISSKVTIGTLSVGRFRINDISANVLITPALLKLAQMSATIYSGLLAGDILLVRDTTPTLEVKQTLRGMNIQPLLVDLFDFSRLDGKGNGKINVRARGKSFVDLRNTLSGSVDISLNDGALIGIDLVSTLKNLPSELAEWNRPAQLDQKTTFSTLSTHLMLDNGIGRNQDFKLVSQLMNVNGGGKIDLRQSIIDYTMNVQANPDEFVRLKGMNIPLKITGPLHAPVYALDFNALIKGKKTPLEKQQALKQELKKQITTILPGHHRGATPSTEQE